MTTAAARLPADGPQSSPAAAAVLALLNRDGEEARLVGGAVRNTLLGLPSGDLDIAATAAPEIVLRRAAEAGLRAVPTGIEHGTVTLLVAGVPVEVTTLRQDIATDGRRATVVFGRDFARDAQRRDFTINALYAAADGTITDPVGGLPDLAARRVRFIGDPEQRIREDYLRILRLFRFHAAYGEGPLDRAALNAALRQRDGLARLSAERIRTELFKLLAARRAAAMLQEVADAGFLDRILATAPDTGAFATLAAESAPDPVLGLAALALYSRDDALRLQERLRLSNADTGRLEAAALVLAALHNATASTGTDRLRALGYRHGVAAVRDGLRLSAARAGAWPLPREAARAARVLDDPLPRCPWSGADLLARDIPAGPQIGRILARAEAAWVAADFPEDAARQVALLDAAIAADGDSTPLPGRPALD